MLIRVSPRAFVVLVLEVLVVALCVALLWQNLKLRRQLVGAARAARSSGRFSAGDPLSTVSVLDLRGHATTLDLRRDRTVILIVDPRCDSCVAILKGISGPARVRVVSTATLETTRQLADVRTRDMTYVVNPGSREHRTKMTAYPQILLVDRGKVVRTCAALGECL